MLVAAMERRCCMHTDNLWAVLHIGVAVVAAASSTADVGTSNAKALLAGPKRAHELQ